MRTSKPHQFVALDGLRGVAAVAVALNHLHETLNVPWDPYNAAWAVDFFFILSGFVLAHAYGAKISRHGYFPIFVTSRVVRLYPLIDLGTLSGAALLIGRGIPVLSLARPALQGALLLPELGQSPYGKGIMPLDPPAWSLFFEIIVSLLFGLRLLNNRLVLLGIIALSSAILIWALLSRQYSQGFTFGTIHYGFVRVLFGFPTGVLLYALRRLVRVPRLNVAFIACVLAAVLLTPWNSPLFSIAVLMILFPIIILSAAQSQDYPRLCEWTGDLSYPLYILHWPIYLAVGFGVRKLAIVAPLAVIGSIAFLMAILCSIMALRLYDEPVRQWLSSLGQRRPSRSLS